MNIGRHVNFLSITITAPLVIILYSIIALGITACRPKEQTRAVLKEDIITVPKEIQDSAYVVILSTASCCGIYYWIDTKTRICLAKVCSNMQSVLTQEQCDRIIETYVKVEK